MGMLQRNARFRTSAIAMHCRAQELRCSTNFMSMSPANNVNLTARSSAEVQPFPPQPVVIASFHTAATFSRNDFCLIFIKLGKSFAISLTPYVVSLVLVIIMISNAVWSPCTIHNCKFQIPNPKFQIPSTKSQGMSKLQSPKQVTRLMFGAWFIDPALAGLGLGFWYLEPYRECFSMRVHRSRD